MHTHACTLAQLILSPLSLNAAKRERKEREMNLLVVVVAERESVNDPSAGSPTETLLRLLLPLNGKVQSTLPQDRPFLTRTRPHNPVARIA